MFVKKQERKKPTSLPKERKNESFIQPKLNFGEKGDKYEVEADKTADQVVNNKGSENAVQKKEGEEEVQQKPLASQISPLIQKMETSEEAPVQKMEEEESVQAKEEEEPIQKKEEEEPVQKMEEEEPIQAKSNKNISNPKSIAKKLRNGSGGTKMDNQTKNEMESGFGVDFSKVNIHNDNEAAQMSQDIGAQAFTNGNDVYFNKDKYNPNSKEGQHLLAHELTHTIQQKGMVQKKIQKIGIDDVRDQMNGRKFTLVEDYKGIRKGTIITIVNWKDNNGNTQGSYKSGKSIKNIEIPKKILTPEYTATRGVSKYEVGLSSQKNSLDKSQKKVDDWKAKEVSYKKNRVLCLKK